MAGQPDRFQIRPNTDVYRARPARVGWKVPFFLNNDWLALTLCDLVAQIADDRPMDIAFGAPMCAWAGGRPSVVRDRMSRGQLERYFEAYAARGVKVALTMSRLDIAPEALDDPYCNQILEVGQAFGAQAIVANDALLDHIKTRFPGVATIASLDKVMCELKDDFSVEADYYRSLFDRFDEVVVRCEAALSDEMVAALEPFAPRVEYIANQVCYPNCRFCREHITSMEAHNDPGSHAPHHECFYIEKTKTFRGHLQNSLFVSESRICSLAAKGFVKAKLAGRNQPAPRALDMLGSYVFEPTGVFPDVKNEVARRFREACGRAGGQIAPYSLP